MCIKTSEKIIELNNAKRVLEIIEKTEFSKEIPYVKLINNGYVDPETTEENIRNNSKFIVELFDKEKQFTLK